MAKLIRQDHIHALDVEEVAAIREYRQQALSDYFGAVPTDQQVLQRQLSEVEMDACFELLAAVEALFKLDCAIRCAEKHKDTLSKAFRAKYNEKGVGDLLFRYSMEEYFLPTWKAEHPDYIRDHQPVFDAFMGAFKFRHWLAHGRYWKPNPAFFEQYTFDKLYLLVEILLEDFTIYTLDSRRAL